MNSTIAIMQPYFFPYIGYFQLIKSVDTIVIYDNIQYTKKGWINRNRILVNNTEHLITLPVKKDSDYLDIVDRELAESWNIMRVKLINLIKNSYRNAPMYTDIIQLIETSLNQQTTNLFEFIFNIILGIVGYLNINTKIIKSSDIPIDHTLKSQDKVLAICKNLKATTYINTIGGTELYNKEVFSANGISLKFIKSNTITYNQFSNFTPWLSIIDILMFNSKNTIQTFLTDYELI